MSKEVNLDEIVNNIVATGALANPNYKRSILEAMKEACRQTLELAAENALLNIDGILEKSNGQQYLVDEGNHYSETNIWIDKNSIISVIDKIN